MWEGMNKVVERDERLESELELSELLSESVFAFIPESEALKIPQPAEGEPLSKEVIREIAKEVAKDVAKVHSEPESAAKKILKEAIKEGMK